MDRSLDSRIAAIEAQLEIKQLAVRYARAVDSRNIDALGDLFSAETNFGEYGKGPEGCRAFYRSPSVIRTFYRSFHQIVGHVITDVEETNARGTVYCRAEHEDGDSWVVILMIYFDRYVKQDGHWLLLGRRPRFLNVHDMRETPRQANFVRWPGREDHFGAELPQWDESWRAFWDEFSEDRGKVTTLP